MSSIAYTSVDRGYLTSGHLTATEYSIDFEVSSRDQRFKTINTQVRSYSGVQETLYNRIDEMWSITATFLTQSQYDLFVEFYSSVANGESFSFDLTGTNAVPGPISKTCTMESFNLSPERIGVTDVFNLSMSFRVI